MKLSQADFGFIVRHTPLVSIDLIVRNPDDAILLGLRRNEPAKDTWFVPGGVIRKGETRAQAFERISHMELGHALSIHDAQFLGVHEHHYPSNFTGTTDFGTHYVVLAYELNRADQTTYVPDDQHHRYRWFSLPDLLADSQVHPNTKAYFPHT